MSGSFLHHQIYGLEDKYEANHNQAGETNTGNGTPIGGFVSSPFHLRHCFATTLGESMGRGYSLHGGRFRTHANFLSDATTLVTRQRTHPRLFQKADSSGRRLPLARHTHVLRRPFLLRIRCLCEQQKIISRAAKNRGPFDF